MKKTILIVLALMGILGCSKEPAQEAWSFYGEDYKAEKSSWEFHLTFNSDGTFRFSDRGGGMWIFLSQDGRYSMDSSGNVSFPDFRAVTSEGDWSKKSYFEELIFKSGKWTDGTPNEKNRFSDNLVVSYVNRTYVFGEQTHEETGEITFSFKYHSKE